MTDAEKAIVPKGDDRSSLEKRSDGDNEKVELVPLLTIDPAVEKRMLWKMDLILLPLSLIICEWLILLFTSYECCSCRARLFERVGSVRLTEVTHLSCYSLLL